jgi:phosphotransferase system HPr (HPr) family protein
VTAVREGRLRAASGLHARPAARIVEEASRFASEIAIESGSKGANAKSIVSLLRAGIPGGAPVRLVATGDDEEQAVERLAQVLEELE